MSIVFQELRRLSASLINLGPFPFRIFFGRAEQKNIFVRGFCEQKIMAGDENKENEMKKSGKDEEQLVTIEKVVAKDNKGIDYDKLISEFCEQFTVHVN